MKQSITVFTTLLILLASCKAVDKLTQFHIDYNQTVTLPPSSVVDLPITILTPDVETNNESKFALNDTRKDKIENIELTTMTLSVTSPDSGNFGFLKSVSVFISAPGLDEVKIAWQDAVPENAGKELQLITSDADLKEYIKKDAFKLKISVLTDETTSSEYKINVYSNFFVDAKILGI